MPDESSPVTAEPTVPSPMSAVHLQLKWPTGKSLFVEMCFGEIVLGTGTGFLVANDRSSHCTFVTNRHNVTGRHQESGKCLSTTQGVPDNVVIYFHKEPITLGEWVPIRLPLYRADGTHMWIEHPRLGSQADMVALNLSWGDDVHRLPYYLALDLDRAGLMVDPVEPVSVIGYPFGMSSTGRYPIWATGFLAQELTIVSPERPVFLIDCRARQGQSGSAVIAYRSGNYRVSDGVKMTTRINAGPAWEFLGIYSGRVNAESDLGRVWHVSAIEELLAAATADALARSAPRALDAPPLPTAIS